MSNYNGPGTLIVIKTFRKSSGSMRDGRSGKTGKKAKWYFVDENGSMEFKGEVNKSSFRSLYKALRSMVQFPVGTKVNKLRETFIPDHVV